LIAWLALGISAGTFVWKFIETYIRWPRIGVVMRQHITIHVGSPQGTGHSEDRLDLVVVNKGAEAVTIANVGVRSEDSSRKIDVQNRRDNGQQIEGPEFPVRVEGHGASLWTIGSDLTKDFPRGTQMVGYAQRYKSFRKYPKRWRNPLKLYETPISYFKN